MQMSTQELQLNAANARLLGLEMVHRAASGHIGGSLSSMDLLTALYFNTMKINVNNPNDPDRDRFVLSKGHCTPALYAILALRGFFPVEELVQFRSIEAHMSGHAEMHHVKGVDMSTGSLGQGLSVAVGMALAGKLDNKDYNVYALMGDGEIAEGQIWEAAMSAAKYNLSNLCAIVDVNGMQIDGKTADVMPSEPLDKKFEAFGFHVIKIDGHDFSDIANAFASFEKRGDKPTAILAKTIKGKGVSFMENDFGWHGKAPNDEQFSKGAQEIKDYIESIK